MAWTTMTLFLGKKACGFLPHVYCTVLSNIIPGFQPVTRNTKIISEYWLWVDLGCDLLGKTNLGRMAKSKVVLDNKFEHTNKELDELLTCQRGAPGALNRGRPASLGRPSWVASCPPWLRFLPAHSSSLCDLCASVLHELHRPNSLIHFFSCIPCLSFACGFDERCWKSIAWCIMVHAWFV
jgi:hypothetical protein